ncbi:MAG TPA: Hsp20/alpha crystallin family protein, partial [Ktedonobacterales bacterium]|nr:Hsp20/alpha crystallin family protein [Ktedonobacterales bacterium]
MTIDRWNPFTSLGEAIERLLQEGFAAPGTIFDAFGQRSFPLNLAESEKQLVLRAPLPGVKPEDVQITIQGDTLTISAAVQSEQERQGQRWLIHELPTGTLERALRLPALIDADQARARIEDGILTLHLPKTEAARTQHIKLTSQPTPQPQEQAPSVSQSQTDAQAHE